MHNSKEKLKTIAEETLTIIKNGYYTNLKGERVDISERMKKSIRDTALIEKIEVEKVNGNKRFDNIKVINGTTIDTIINLRNIEKVDGEITTLNFASAYNPGGGFMNGMQAQEESLARASTLYDNLTSQMAMYEHNKRIRNPLYSDLMIYSPGVTIIRGDNGRLLDLPIEASFITSPAVNARVCKERNIDIKKIQEVMKTRIEKIVALAISKKPQAIILGAFGCGVFGNDPYSVAKLFKEAIGDIISPEDDVKIVFSILDRRGDIIPSFKKGLGTLK